MITKTHVLRSTHFRVSLDRGSDFDREIGKSFSLVPGEIGTFMVIIFSLLFAFFFLTGDEFSTVGLSLGYIGGPYGLQNNFFENDVGLNIKKMIS